MRESVHAPFRVLTALLDGKRRQIQRYPLQPVDGGSESPTSPDVGDVEMAKSRREELMRKLEGMGYDVGYRFAERYGCLATYTRGTERHTSDTGMRGGAACLPTARPRTARACWSRWT